MFTYVKAGGAGMGRLLFYGLAFVLAGCGTLASKTDAISPGDSRDQVRSVMGAPDDRQFQGTNEAWQYCKNGAGFGYNDHRVIWFLAGKVTGITTYRTHGPGCVGRIQPVRWEDAPDTTIEVRRR